MPEFRCKMLNERGGTLFSADITADTLDGAIRQAAEVLSHKQLVLAITACTRIRSLVRHEPTVPSAVERVNRVVKICRTSRTGGAAVPPLLPSEIDAWIDFH